MPYYCGTSKGLSSGYRKFASVGAKQSEATTVTGQESCDWIGNLQITSQERRSPRMHVRIPVLLLWEENGGERSEKAHTLTISWFGCAIQGYSAFRLGSSIQLYREGKTVHARVVHCLQDHVTRLVKVGLEFVEDGRSFWEFPACNQ